VPAVTQLALEITGSLLKSRRRINHMDRYQLAKYLNVDDDTAELIHSRQHHVRRMFLLAAGVCALMLCVWWFTLNSSGSWERPRRSCCDAGFVQGPVVCLVLLTGLRVVLPGFSLEEQIGRRGFLRRKIFAVRPLYK
jgi:hypothetical protein